MASNLRYQKVWDVVSNIPVGSVATYGEVARLAGFPRCARMVSAALRAAPTSLKLPWHRVINAQGKISFPKNSDHYQIQKKRLIAEGIDFSLEKVNLNYKQLMISTDEILWRQ